MTALFIQLTNLSYYSKRHDDDHASENAYPNESSLFS